MSLAPIRFCLCTNFRRTVEGLLVDLDLSDQQAVTLGRAVQRTLGFSEVRVSFSGTLSLISTRFCPGIDFPTEV